MSPIDSCSSCCERLMCLTEAVADIISLVKALEIMILKHSICHWIITQFTNHLLHDQSDE